MDNYMEIKENVQIFETNGFSCRRIYQISPYINKVKVKDESSQYQSVANFFVTAFLPHGYPDSVSKDYLVYQMWDSIQAFASSLTGSICTHAVLKGVGVGDENASTLAATVTWLIKDGVSMVGRIGFAWLQGTKLDSECKKWRLFADVFNDIAMFLDLISAYFQNYFLFIVCISGLMKSLVGVAGGCTRAALTQHQARNNNMADVSAKDGSQETFVNLVALLCSLLILPVVTQSFILTWAMFISMTIVHLIANYFAVKSVTMETFNEERLSIFASHYFREGLSKDKLLSVSEVNRKENVFFSWPGKFSIQLGASISNIIKEKSCDEVRELLKIYENCDYLLSISKENFSRITIYVSFSSKASSQTFMEAFYQACYIRHLLQNKDSFLENSYETISREFVTRTFPNFMKHLSAMNFNTRMVYFSIDSWRAEW